MFETENKRSFWEFFIRNRKFTFVIILALIIVGVFSVIQIPKEAEPDIDIPIVFITVPYPGASAEAVEQLVTKPIEDKLIGLEDIDSIQSNSKNNVAMIIAQFDVNADIKEKMDEVREKVDMAKPELPENAMDPSVGRFNLTDLPIYTISVSGPYSIPKLQTYAEEIKHEINRVSGVSEVRIYGTQERGIFIMVDKDKLSRYNIPLMAVTQAIGQAQSNMPIGAIETVGSNYTLHFAGQIKSAKEVAQIPIFAMGDKIIKVKNIAKIVDGYKDQSTIARYGQSESIAQPSVSLSVLKKSGGNVLKTVDDINEKIDELEKDLPENITIAVVEDNAQYIKKELGSLVTNGIETVLLVILLLFIFLGWKESLLAGLAIPLTFLITFIFLSFIGYTLNFLTLFSLILALGILVDGSIVVTEAMHTHIKQGEDPKKAAIATIREFKTPLISGTLTTVFAFLPMMLTGGIMGKFISSIPVTITIILLTSLVVALGFITTIGMRIMKQKHLYSYGEIQKNSIKEAVMGKFQNAYGKIIGFLLHHKWFRRLILFLMAVLFVGSMALPAAGLLKVQMFPMSDLDSLYINIEKSIGTPLEQTDTAVKKIENEIKKDSRVESYLVTVGASSNVGGMAFGMDDSHLANIIVNFKEDREEKSYEIADEYQDKFDGFKDAEVEILQLESGPPSAAPVEVQIKGEELDVIEKIVLEFEDMIKKIKGTINTETTIPDKNIEFILEINRDKAKKFGVDTAMLAMNMRNAINGMPAAVIHDKGEDVGVVVRYSLDKKGSTRSIPQTSISTIQKIPVMTQAGEMKVGDFVAIKLAETESSINRQDGERTMSVTANVKEGVIAQDVFKEIEKQMEGMEIKEGYEAVLGGEQEEITMSYGGMIRAMIIGIFLIAGLLIWQFRSYRQPLFILATIPLAIIGIFPGLVLVNVPLSFPGLIGIVALGGIVVNNGIILIDKINRNRRAGMLRDTAIIDAGKARLRPIVLTTITTVCGVLPLTLTNEDWGMLGYSIVFGLCFSAFMTLFIVPSLYYGFAEKQVNN